MVHSRNRFKGHKDIETKWKIVEGFGIAFKKKEREQEEGYTYN